jgi:hypothetical protein
MDPEHCFKPLRFGVGEYSDQKEFTIFYVGNKEGQVYKVAQWTQDGKLK